MPPLRNAITAVQRTQKALSMGVRAPDPDELLRRDTWLDASTYLAERWFPRSTSKELAITELIRESYLHALYWYPIIQQRCPGTFRPNWFVGTVLSWLRRVVSPATGQWFLTVEQLARDPDLGATIARAADLPGTTNRNWVAGSLAFLADVARTGGRKAVVSKGIVETLAYLDEDASLQQELEWKASARRRRILRQNGAGTASYLRIGRTRLIAADEQAVRRTASEIAWMDLREQEIAFMAYQLRVGQEQSGGKRLLITLQPQVLSDAKLEIKAIVTSDASAIRRLQALRHFLHRFEAQHRYAPNAWPQFVELSRLAKSQSKRHIKAQLPREIDKRVRSIKTTNVHVIPKPNPFLSPVDLREWERFFSPYRL